MPSDKYKERSDREFDELGYDTRHGFWYGLRWYAAGAAVILASIALLWALGVFTSDVRGAGDAHKQNQSGTNRVVKQEMFEQKYQDIQNADKRIDTFAAAKAEDPTYTNKVNYTGAINVCNQLVADYNAEARKQTSADWKAADLPSVIDQNDPKFDCKESAQ